MTAPSGMALRLRLELSRLAEKHGVVLTPRVLPLLEPITSTGPICADCQVTTCEADLSRTRFREFCFGALPDPRSVPVLLAHDASRVVGRCNALFYDRAGAVRACITLTDAAAFQLPGVSVGADLTAYELHEESTPQGCWATITGATVRELSLTSKPAQVGAVVERRWPGAASETYELARRKVEVLSRLCAMLQETAAGAQR